MSLQTKESKWYSSAEKSVQLLSVIFYPCFIIVCGLITFFCYFRPIGRGCLMLTISIQVLNVFQKLTSDASKMAAINRMLRHSFLVISAACIQNGQGVKVKSSFKKMQFLLIISRILQTSRNSILENGSKMSAIYRSQTYCKYLRKQLKN